MTSSSGNVLHHNASSFFDKVFKAHGKDMKCAAGCDACCYTSFSLFSWEADLIKEWFIKLSDDEQVELKNSWTNNLKKGVDPHGKEQQSCPFLVDGKCSIYPVRPLICRTQGLPLLIDKQVASCPLNFHQQFPDKAFWLDLERLNTLSSLLESTRPNQNQRVELISLREMLKSM